MNSRLHAQLKGAPVGAGLLQRKTGCGGSNSLPCHCEECRKQITGAQPEHRTVQPTPRASGHDFSRVSVYSAHDGSRSRSSSSTGGHDGVFINGPDEGSKPNPPKPPTTKKPVKKAKCPTDIQVINIDQLRDSQFGKNGMLTGIGAVAYMEVSDADRNDLDGTQVTETVKQIKNTCGARAKKVCSNESGENVPFVVGAETKVVGTKMPALRNTFYDLHMYTHDVSILHEYGKDTCEIQCQQTYHCGGKQFGPEFIITYSAKKDQVANFYDVTRIRVNKAAKAAAP